MARDDRTVLATEGSADPDVIELSGGEISALAASPNGRWIVAGTVLGEVHVLDADRGRILHELGGLDERIGSVAITRDGATVVAATEDAAPGRVWLWNLESGESERRFRNKEPVVRAVLGREGYQCLTVSGGHIQRWAVPPAAGDPPLRSFRVEFGTPLAVATTPEASHVAIGSEEGHFRVFDLVKAAPGASIDCGEPVRAVALTADAGLGLSADEDRTIRVWDAAGEHVRALQGHPRPVDMLAVGPDDRRLVSISGDGTVMVWQLGTGELVTTLHGTSLTACVVGVAGQVILGDADGVVSVLPDEWLRAAAEHDLGRGEMLESVVADAPIVIAEILEEDEEEEEEEAAAGTVLVGGADEGAGDESGPDEDDDSSSAPHLLRMLIAEAALSEARDLYRDGDFVGALGALDAMSDNVQKLPTWRVFRGYVAAIVAGGLSPEGARPEGSFEDIDAMHFFLVRDEIAEAKQLLEDDRSEAAREVLERAVGYAPHFPYANFLLAVALHNSFAERVAEGDGIPAGEAGTVLGEALDHARVGATDPDISEANMLVEVLEMELQAVGEASDGDDTSQVEELGQRLTRIMEEGVGDGIESEQQLDDVTAQMRGLLRDIEAASGKVAGDDARKALGRVGAEVKRHLDRLDELRTGMEQAEALQRLADEFGEIRAAGKRGEDPADLLDRIQQLDRDVQALRKRSDGDSREALDRLASVIADDMEQLEAAAAVAPLAERYGEIMENASITSAAEAKALAKTLRALAKDVDRAKKRHGASAGAALDELDEAISRNLAQLDEVKAPDPNVAEFNALAQDFQSAMQSVEGGISSQEQLFEFAGKLAEIHTRAGKLKKKMKDREGKKAVDQLVEAIDNIIKQLA